MVGLAQSSKLADQGGALGIARARVTVRMQLRGTQAKGSFDLTRCSFGPQPQLCERNIALDGDAARRLVGVFGVARTPTTEQDPFRRQRSARATETSSRNMKTQLSFSEFEQSIERRLIHRLLVNGEGRLYVRHQPLAQMDPVATSCRRPLQLGQLQDPSNPLAVCGAEDISQGRAAESSRQEHNGPSTSKPLAGPSLRGLRAIAVRN